eukprot:TRINITY_DN44499_c0_g1_i2.p2 TRINITY_DN44499_c0_g1~~TRINITY_DN44499_c0_g1_i2.p2  ORF type:complete len:246 (+),score=55.19 TRINITY_DN44499_c0_g1_i2:72-740(+)
MPSGVPAPPGITRREDDAPRINVRPYGCLGEQNVTRQLPDRPGMRVPNVQRKASGPNARTAIVDPAGLYHIRGSGPDLAGAASRQIYDHIGLKIEFPQEVQDAISETTQAKYHRYAGDNHVIHVAGPDLRQEGVSALAEAYKNVFQEFCKTNLKCLRLVPISGGVFLGDFRPELEQITVESLRQGYQMLTEEERHQLRQCTLDMCVYEETEFEGFRRAFGQA